MKRVYFFAVIFAALLPFFLKAQDATPSAAPETVASDQTAMEDDEQEMIVNADSADVQLDEANHPIAIELEGNVSIEDVTMRFTAKKMTIHLDKNNKPTNIEAVGGVTLRKLDGSGSATGETGRYDAELNTVVLKGNCVILQERNTLKGEQVVYDRKTGKILLKGASLTLPLKRRQNGTGFADILKGESKEKKRTFPEDGKEDDAKLDIKENKSKQEKSQK